MAEMYDVSVKVISVKGTCDGGHKPGDEWIIKGDKTPGGICMGAFNSLFPEARVLAFGGLFPWSTDPDTTQIACPDGKNPVVFELKRLQK